MARITPFFDIDQDSFECQVRMGEDRSEVDKFIEKGLHVALFWAPPSLNDVAALGV